MRLKIKNGELIVTNEEFENLTDIKYQNGKLKHAFSILWFYGQPCILCLPEQESNHLLKRILGPIDFNRGRK